MDNDLADVGLNALEALEAADQQEKSEPDNETDTGKDEEDTSETGGQETTPEDTSDTKDDTTDDSDDVGENGENKDETPEDEDKQENNSDEDRKDEEMSDEEFEKLAEKRGYSKKTEDTSKQNGGQDETMEKLLKRPDEIPKDKWDDLPDENKVIYNALPYIVAEGKNGVVQVKTPDQLPDGFEFKDQKSMMKFQNDLQAQELKATQMKNAIEARAEREQRAAAEREEAQMVIGEIENLQKSGDLPRPTAKPGTKEFDDDPAVLLINKVLDFRSMKASQGSNLSVRDSLLLYKAEHPSDFVKKEAKGDIERKNIAKKVAGNSKATSSAVNGDEDNKPHYYKAGMSTEDVLDAVLNDMD